MMNKIYCNHPDTPISSQTILLYNRTFYLAYTLLTLSTLSISHTEFSKLLPSIKKNPFENFVFILVLSNYGYSWYNAVKSWLKGTKYFKIDLTRSQPAIHSFEWCFPKCCYFWDHLYYRNFSFSLDLCIVTPDFILYFIYIAAVNFEQILKIETNNCKTNWITILK